LGKPENYKFFERNVQGTIKITSRDTRLACPSILFEIRYLQNNFLDYIDSEKKNHPGFVRQHGTQSISGTEIICPFTFYESACKSFSLTYGRKLYFDETFVPYEGEGKGFFNEKYGIKNFASCIGSKAFNLGKYYPGYFLIGRRSFANGRDSMMSTLNKPIYFQSGCQSPYNNSLKLMENFSMSPVMKFRNINIVISTGFDHVCERASIGAVPGQQFTYNFKGEFSIDIIGLFSAESTLESNKKHGMRLSPEYGFSKTMIITSNICEYHHSPGSEINFTWDDSIFSIKGSFDYRLRKTFEYISNDPSKRSRRDDVYYDAMSTSIISEKNKGYSLSIKYETDLPVLHSFFSSFYTFPAIPKILIEYDFIKNQYDYKTTVSPEPYDRCLFTSQLVLDVHENIKGGLSGRISFEKWYNRDTRTLYREVFSYELGGQITLQW